MSTAVSISLTLSPEYKPKRYAGVPRLGQKFQLPIDEKGMISVIIDFNNLGWLRHPVQFARLVGGYKSIYVYGATMDRPSS